MTLITGNNSGLRRYLKLGVHPHLLARAEIVRVEAAAIVRWQTWQEVLRRETFEAFFAPYSGASRALQALLGDCPLVLLLAVSLGQALSERVRQHMAANRCLEGYLMDRMGSFWAETAMRCLDRQAAEPYCTTGGRTTRRYSPGYRDFDLGAQRRFVDRIGDRWPALHISPSGLLLPEKTITAIIGVWPTSATESGTAMALKGNTHA